MERIVNKIRFWDSKAPTTPLPTAAAKPDRSSVVCSDETINYAMYHLCAYDPILEVLICVGDNVPAVVLARGRRRVSLPLRKCVHWLECHIFAGTSSFLLLSSECLLLVDYGQRSSSSGLFPQGRNGALFACLHVPQGVTWGAVGCRNGSVMYWKLKHKDGRTVLSWAALTTDVLGFCRAFLPTPAPASCGHIYTIDTYPTNPNALVAVIAGVPGVCKWYLDENRLSSFFSASDAVKNSGIAACRVTPGGAYITAITFDASTVFIWSENGKKKKDRRVELFWAVDILCHLPSSVETASEAKVEEGVTPLCGFHIARGAGSLVQVQSDKKCHMYFLLYSAEGVVELVVDVEGKQILQREDILAHVTAMRLQPNTALDAKEEFAVQRVIPCSQFMYWLGAWTETDLDTLIMTSDDCGPLLIERCRSRRNVERVTELGDLPHGAAPWSEMLLVAPSVETMDVLWGALDKTQGAADPWSALLRGATSGDACDVAKRGDIAAFLGVLPDGPSDGICFLPLSNECVPVPYDVIRQHAACLSCTPSGGGGQLVILERAMPGLPQRTELILRAVADEVSVSVFAVHLTPPRVERLMVLSKDCLMPDAASTGSGIALAQQAVLVECRVVKSNTAPLSFELRRSGWSILLQLSDNSLALVDLSDAKDGEKEPPQMVRYPSGLFPAGTSVTSFDTVWTMLESSPDHANGGRDGVECLALISTLSDRKGVIVWDMCRMRLLSYFPCTDYGEWRYNKVITRPQETCFSTTSEFGGITVAISRICSSNNAIATDPVEGSEGRVVLRDILGRLLLPLCVRHGSDASGGWCLRRNEEDAVWHPLAPAGAFRIVFGLKIVRGEVVAVTTDAEYTLGETLVPSGRIAAVEEEQPWPYSILVWHSREKEDEMEPTVPSHGDGGSITQGGQETVMLYNEKEIGFFCASKLATSGSEMGPATVCRVENGRSIEHVVFCAVFNAALVLAKDANKWWWVNLLDLSTAEPLMEPHAMTHFTDNDDLCIRLVPVEDCGLHIYIIGRGGAPLGHLVLLPAASDETPRPHVCSPFLDARYAPAPPSFRSYRRFLPPPPTMKQEQGFLKRLMTLPWEEVVLKIEDEVLREEQAESFDEFRQRLVTAAPGDCHTAPPERRDAEAERRELLPGNRYTELKATAARENVSITEARRITSENQARLRERGERISQIESKSRELAQEAATFQDLARKLKEKQRSSWL